MADKFTETISEDRTDLTQVPTLTIDPTDARDFDDAISLTINEVGNWSCRFISRMWPISSQRALPSTRKRNVARDECLFAGQSDSDAARIDQQSLG